MVEETGGQHGGLVVYIQVLSPNIERGLGSIPAWYRTFVCGMYLFSLCLCGFLPTAQNMQVRLTDDARR